MRALMVILVLFCSSAQAEKVPMKYCELGCVQSMIKTMHNDANGLFAASSSSMSSVSPLTAVKQYCADFVKDEKECVKVVFGSGKYSNHESLHYPFDYVSNKRYCFRK